MQIDIRQLEPNLLDDYLDFFDNVAFTDHQEWAWCDCFSHYHGHAAMYIKSGFIKHKELKDYSVYRKLL